jgi:hypothetical protein
VLAAAQRDEAGDEGRAEAPRRRPRTKDTASCGAMRPWCRLCSCRGEQLAGVRFRGGGVGGELASVGDGGLVLRGASEREKRVASGDDGDGELTCELNCSRVGEGEAQAVMFFLIRRGGGTKAAGWN